MLSNSEIHDYLVERFRFKEKEDYKVADEIRKFLNRNDIVVEEDYNGAYWRSATNSSMHGYVNMFDRGVAGEITCTGSRKYILTW